MLVGRSKDPRKDFTIPVRMASAGRALFTFRSILLCLPPSGLQSGDLYLSQIMGEVPDRVEETKAQFTTIV